MPLTSTELGSRPSLQNTDGVKALLDKLKSSQAWQQTVSAAEPPAPAPHESRVDSNLDVRPSVAFLLAQLADARAGHQPVPPPSQTESRLSGDGVTGGSSDVVSSQPSIGSEVEDLHAFSFQQTVSYLAQLSAKPGFIESIRRVRYRAGN